VRLVVVLEQPVPCFIAPWQKTSLPLQRRLTTRFAASLSLAAANSFPARTHASSPNKTSAAFSGGHPQGVRIINQSAAVFESEKLNFSAGSLQP
jgi:hypothetical protein